MKAKKLRVTSPFGEACFPRLNTPDTKFNPAGRYSVDLALDPNVPEHDEYLRAIEAIAVEAVGLEAKFPIKNQEDKLGNLTGKRVVKYASTYPPKLFDGNLQPLKDKIVGAGSTIRVSATINIYKNVAGRSGLNLYLDAVQVKDLVEPLGATPESYGFKDESKAPPTPDAAATKAQQPPDKQGDLPF